MDELPCKTCIDPLCTGVIGTTQEPLNDPTVIFFAQFYYYHCRRFIQDYVSVVIYTFYNQKSRK